MQSFQFNETWSDAFTRMILLAILLRALCECYHSPLEARSSLVPHLSKMRYAGDIYNATDP
jgi:hypothetical protein